MTENRMTICPVCDGKAWRTVYRLGSWDVGQCEGCGFARIDPLPTRDSRPEFYKEDKVVTRNVKKNRGVISQFLRDAKVFLNRFYKRTKGGIFRKNLDKHLKAGSKVLDIGCGDGGFIFSLTDRYKCSGIEISDYLADHARRRGKVNIKTGDFQSTDFNGEKFDGITLISLIEHLDDPGKTVQKCYDQLNSGGVFLLKTPNYNCLNRIIMREKWTGLRPPDHVVYFDPKNLSRLLKRVGFQKIKTTAWPLNDNMYCEAVKP